MLVKALILKGRPESLPGIPCDHAGVVGGEGPRVLDLVIHPRIYERYSLSESV